MVKSILLCFMMLLDRNCGFKLVILLLIWVDRLVDLSGDSLLNVLIFIG